MLRIVVRAGMTHDMADLLLEHLREQTRGARVARFTAPTAPLEKQQAFAH